MKRTFRPQRWAFAAGLAATLSGAPTVFAQGTPATSGGDTQPAPRFQGEATVTEVLLDVLVTDAKGNVIVGLDKSDFAVKEGGKPVELTGVTFYSNRRFLEAKDGGAVTKKGFDIDKVPENRYFILFFDDQKNAEFDSPGQLAQQLEAGRRSKEWIAKELLANDYVAVVSYDVKLKVHQDFTRDRAALAQAVSDAIQGKDAETNWPSRIPKKEDGPSLLTALPQGNDLRDKTGTIYDGVRLLAEAGRGIVGRKNLILFTTGFGNINSFGQYVPDPRYYPPMMQALNGGNVALYAIDLVRPGTEHPLSSAMNQLAIETGGLYLFNFTNFLTPLKKISQENNGYYLLSYQATHPGEASGFQKVEVKATNPEFKVRARDGYRYGEPRR